MATTDIKTCHICEALCGLEITHEDGKVLQIRGNKRDPLSEGYICPKGVAIQDLHTDPNRLREPLQRTKGGWRPISWEDAYSEATQNLTRIRENGMAAEHWASIWETQTSTILQHPQRYPRFSEPSEQRVNSQPPRSTNCRICLPHIICSAIN